MRRLGYALVDRLVEHHETLAGSPPLRVGDAEALLALIGGPPPDAPGDPETELAALFEHVLPWGQRADHPRFFARIGSPSTYVGALADAAAAGVNAFTGSWTGGSGPSAVELTVIDWLRGWCGMPEQTAGVLTSGGSLASLTAFAAAREARLGGPQRDRRRLRLRPDACIAAARRGAARRAHPGAGLRRRPAARAGRAAGRRRGGPPSRAAAVLRRRHRGHDEHGRDRPVARAARREPRARAVAARRRRLRRAGGADPRRRGGARRPRARRLARGRPAQVALPAVRDRLRAGARARPARARVLARGRLPARHRGRPGGLPRPQPGAHARRPRAEAVAVGADVRPRRLPRGDRPRHRARRARRGAAARARRLGGRHAGLARDRHLPPRRARRRRPHAAVGRHGRGRLRRAEHDRRRRSRRPAPVHDQPAHDVRGDRRDARRDGAARSRDALGG